ncbi:MAG: carbohydrate-binding domain-containing protein, partial [Lachnospiraceae bacterium]|nr:carbohydrate-binding domain-containing protein [Lachnospiraceae bacterium]
MKIRKAAAGMLIGVWVLSGCVGRADDPDEAAKTQQTTSDGETDQDPAALNAKQLAKLAGDYSDKAQKAEWSMESATVLNLSDGGVLIEGDGVKENAGVLTITKKGTYVLQGSMEKGRIEVDADEQNVTLVLNNVSIASETSAPICIKEAKNVYLIPADGSKNRILDRRASADSSEDDDTEEETAAIYSKDDLVLCGTGSLYVEGGYKDGIKGKDELQILNVSLTVKANDDGMIGNDSVCIKDASVTIEAGDDGIKATEETDQGYVVIDSGNIAITAKNKGIDAVNVPAGQEPTALDKKVMA